MVRVETASRKVHSSILEGAEGLILRFSDDPEGLPSVLSRLFLMKKAAAIRRTQVEHPRMM